MANTCYLKSYSYQGRYMYLNCTQEKDIATNSSTINWVLTVTGGSAGYYTTGPTVVKINGTQVYYRKQVAWDTYEFPAAKGSISGSLTIPHDENGNATINISLSTSIYTGVIQEYKETWVLDKIDRFAYLVFAPNFTDEENPTIKYSNPAGSIVTSLQACISLNGSSPDIAYRDIPKGGTTYTFNLTSAEKQLLYNATLNDSTSRTVFFYIKTVINGETFYNNLSRIFTVTDAIPELSALVIDTNNQTVALTGDSLTTLVKGYSTAAYEISATAKKAANIVEYKATSGSASLSTSSGSFANTETSNFSFMVKDNRGLTTTKNINLILINYFKPTCSASVKLELDTETTVKASISVSGSFFNGSFGYAKNNVTLYIKHSSSNSWISLSNPTVSGNTYKLDFNISGLDYTKPFTYQCKVVDALESVTSAEETLNYNPVFDWGAEDFNLNVPLNMSGNTVLRHTDTNRVVLSAESADIYLRPNGTSTDGGQLRLFTDGKATLNGSRVLTFDLVYPVGAVYISANSNNPSNIFGGSWQSINNSLGVYMWKRTA